MPTISIGVQRWIFAAIVAAHVALAEAIKSGAFPSWTVRLGVIATFLGGLVTIVGPSLAKGASKRPPPLACLALVGFCLAFLPAAACAGVPTPQGVSVKADDGGVQTCVDWARAHCPTCGGDAGFGK